jgi:hypothetical protein
MNRQSTGNSREIDGKQSDNRWEIDRKSAEKGPFNSDRKARDNFMACPDDEQAIPLQMDVFWGGRFFDVFRPCTVVVV